MSDQVRQERPIKPQPIDRHRTGLSSDDVRVQPDEPVPDDQGGTQASLEAKQHPPGGSGEDQDKPGVPPHERHDR